MKRIVKSLLLCMAFMMLFSFSPEAKARLSKKSVTLFKGQKTKLKVKGTKKKVKWKSSNKAIASVNSKGKITAKNQGRCIITAKVGKKKLKCIVTVKKKRVSVYLSSLKAYRAEGEMYKFENKERKDVFGNAFYHYLASNGAGNASASSKASATYRIDGKYTKMTGTFFIPTTNANVKHYVCIMGDNSILYENYVKGGSDSLYFEINLTGVKDLTVVMYGNHSWATTLGDPILIG